MSFESNFQFLNPELTESQFSSENTTDHSSDSSIQMICPKCGHDRVRRNGKTLKGTQRYQCKSCKGTFTGGKRGRPTILKHRALNAAEQKRWERYGILPDE